MVITGVLENDAYISVKAGWISPRILPTLQFLASVRLHYVELSNLRKLANTPRLILTYAVTWVLFKF